MKILIVDDEYVSRNLLLKKMQLIGECTLSEDGEKAFQIYEQALADNKPFDLITLDISMPKMDGIQLLEKIRKKEKEMDIVRDKAAKIIMISARMNVSTIKTCIKLGCNGYIAKPVTKYQLLGSLGRMGFEQPADIKDENEFSPTKIVSRIIKRFYAGRIKLPVMPRILNDVKKLSENQKATIEELIGILEKDIALSARMISIANSALYKGVDNADSLGSALVRLGLKPSLDLISTLVTRDLFKSENSKVNEMLEKLWLHSFACGVIAKQMAQDLKMDNADTIFLMGVVHDIGKMFMIRAIVDMHPELDFDADEVKTGIHEIHTTFGAALLKKMKFAAEFILIAEFHHLNDFSDDDNRALLIINLADYLAKEIGYGFLKMEPEGPSEFADLENLNSFKQLNFDRDKIMEGMEKAKEIIASCAEAF